MGEGHAQDSWAPRRAGTWAEDGPVLQEGKCGICACHMPTPSAIPAKVSRDPGPEVLESYTAIVLLPLPGPLPERLGNPGQSNEIRAVYENGEKRDLDYTGP